MMSDDTGVQLAYVEMAILGLSALMCVCACFWCGSCPQAESPELTEPLSPPSSPRPSR